jgi:hypothetical protein
MTGGRGTNICGAFSHIRIWIVRRDLPNQTKARSFAVKVVYFTFSSSKADLLVELKWHLASVFN